MARSEANANHGADGRHIGGARRLARVGAAHRAGAARARPRRHVRSTPRRGVLRARTKQRLRGRGDESRAAVARGAGTMRTNVAARRRSDGAGGARGRRRLPRAARRPGRGRNDPGAARLAGVRYTGSGHLASALAMDKDLSKQLFRAAGVTTADWLMAPAYSRPKSKRRARLAGDREAVEAGIDGRPDARAASAKQLRRDRRGVPLRRRGHDRSVHPGRELTVGILGDEALPVGEIIPKHEIYDYECKYTAGMARRGVSRGARA